MSGRQWTPYELSIILHHYASMERFPREGTALYGETINALMRHGVIDYVDGIPRTTERGDHFVEMLLQTPLPEQVWLDPRDRKRVMREGDVLKEMSEAELLAGIEALYPTTPQGDE